MANKTIPAIQTNEGNVGVGVTSPSQKLHVDGNILSSYNILTSLVQISSASDAASYISVDGYTAGLSYAGTYIGLASLAGFGVSANLYIGGGFPIIPAGWSGTISGVVYANAVSLATSALLQTSPDGSTWTTRSQTVAASGTETLTYSVSNSATPLYVRFTLLQSSGVSGVSATDCSIQNIIITNLPSLPNKSSISNRFLVDGLGNVGIGITNPVSKLHVSGAAATIMRLDSNTLTSVAQFQAKANTDGVLIAGMYGPNPVAGTIFGANTSGAAFLGTTTLATVHPTLLAIGTSNTIPIIFGTNGIERMRLDSVGGISIGTPSQLNSSRVSIADSALKTSAGNCLTFATATAGSNDFQLIISRSSNTDGYYALQSVEQGVGYKNIVFNQNGGNVGIGLTNPSTKLEVGYFLDAFTNKITVSCRYENQPEFNFKLGQAGTNFDWIGGVISCGDDGNYNGIINFKTANAGRDTPTTKMVIRANGNVGINITTPTSKLHVVETTPTGSRIQLGSISTSALMNANLVNDFLILTAPFNAVPASTSNNNAKWGIKMGGGSVDAPNALGKSACIYAVSEEDAVGGAGYNRKVGIALHTSPFDLPSVERFRITNIGDVGIGVTNPSNKLQISGGGISFTTSTGLAVPMIGILPTNIAYVGPYNSPADGNSPTLVLFNHARSVEQTWFYASGTIAMSLNRQGRFHIGDLNNAPNSLLSVGPSSSTTAVSGMCFGNDASANLYRSAASTIKTDGSLTVVGGASFGGNVGIGVTNPDLRLHIDASNAYPAAAGANTSGFLTLRAKTAGASHGMYMGVADASPWGSWIQCGDSVNSAVNYPLLLNPNGGNVGIGLRNPATSLDIAGSLRVTGIGQIGPAGGYGIALFNAGTNTFIGQSYGRASGIQFTDAAGLNTVYIANGGNVGIGTTNPSGRLSVDFVGSSAFNVCDSASSNVRVTVGTVNDAGTNYGLIQTYQHNTNTAGVSPLTIQPFGGNVGIGITNSSALFHVFSIAGRYINFTPASVSGLLVQRNQSIGSQGTTVLTLVNAQGAEATPERGTSLNLDIGYGGTSTTTAGTIARGARIAALNYNVYDATAASQNASLVFYTATGGSLTEATRITADGKVGIGITNPTAKLQVVQSNAAGVAAILLSSDESTIQGPSANTQIRMGSNLVLNGSNILTLGTNNVTRMVIDVTGNVGIGTVAPTAQNNYKFLQVNGQNSAIIEAMVNNVRIGGIDSDSSSLYFGSIGSFPIVFRTAVVEKMRITAAGLVGIGTATPTTLLSVGGAGSTLPASGITFGGDAEANIYRSEADHIKTDGSFVVTNTLIVGGGQNGVRILKNGSDSISSNLYIANAANTRAYNFQPNAAGTNLALWTYNSANAWQNSVNFNYNGSVGIGTTTPSGRLHIVSTIAGETVLRADGTNGTLFSVVDDLSDSLMSVNNSAGLPVLEVFADDRVVAGQYGSGDFVLINNKVGLGTSNPANKLTVIGGASIGSTTYNTAAPSNGLIVEGNVGIGATNPASKLTVVGDIGLYKNGGDTIVSCLYIANAANNRAFNFQLNADGTRFDLWSYNSANAWQNNVSFNYDGNVGINKTAPTTKLDVVGSFRVVGTTNVGGIFVTGSQANQGNIRPAVNNGTVLISDDSGLSTRGLTVSNGGGAIISSTDANYDMLTLQIGGTTNHSFNKDGNVGIGATNPNSARLHIKGNGSVPVIRVETALIESPAGGTAGRTLRGWLPIMTGAAGTDKVYIPLFGPLN